MHRPLSRVPLLSSLLAALWAAACGSGAVEPNVELADLVGTWDASSLTFTSVADPSTSVDVVEFGASFFLDIQPSGDYTSSLSFEGSTATELGRVEVEGDRLIFFVDVTPTGARVDTATFDLRGDRLDLEGRTVFDFDLDGIGEAAELEAALVR